MVAGSCCHGYWIEPQHGDIRGPSAGMSVNQGMDRTKLDLLRFKDNDVHSSNFAMSLYPNRWRPGTEARIENLRTYRNFIGIFLHVDKKVRMVGGYYGDNGKLDDKFCFQKKAYSLGFLVPFSFLSQRFFPPPTLDQTDRRSPDLEQPC